MRGIYNVRIFVGVHWRSCFICSPFVPLQSGRSPSKELQYGLAFVPSSVLLGVLTAFLRCPPWCWMMCPPSQGLVSPCLPLSPHMCACVGWRRSCLPVSPCPPEGRTMKPAGKQASKQASQPARQAGRQAKQASQPAREQASKQTRQGSKQATEQPSNRATEQGRQASQLASLASQASQASRASPASPASQLASKPACHAGNAEQAAILHAGKQARNAASKQLRKQARK